MNLAEKSLPFNTKSHCDKVKKYRLERVMFGVASTKSKIRLISVSTDVREETLGPSSDWTKEKYPL